MNITDDIIIDKDQKSIWNILIDINNWGRWSPIVDHAVIYGQLRNGTNFKCNSGKWEFDCEISDLEFENNISFKGRTIGLDLFVAWQLISEDSGIKIAVSLDASGWMVTLFRKRLRDYFEYTLHRWLMSLKALAEKGAVKIEELVNDEESPERQGTVFTTPFNFLSDIKKSKQRKNEHLK